MTAVQETSRVVWWVCGRSHCSCVLLLCSTRFLYHTSFRNTSYIYCWKTCCRHGAGSCWRGLATWSVATGCNTPVQTSPPSWWPTPSTWLWSVGSTVACVDVGRPGHARCHGTVQRPMMSTSTKNASTTHGNSLVTRTTGWMQPQGTVTWHSLQVRRGKNYRASGCHSFIPKMQFLSLECLFDPQKCRCSFGFVCFQIFAETKLCIYGLLCCSIYCFLVLFGTV